LNFTYLLTYLLTYFFAQLVASNDYLLTWIELFSLVDHFTIVPTFVGLFYDRNWIGQRHIDVLYACRLCQKALISKSVNLNDRDSFVHMLRNHY